MSLAIGAAVVYGVVVGYKQDYNGGMLSWEYTTHTSD